MLYQGLNATDWSFDAWTSGERFIRIDEIARVAASKPEVVDISSRQTGYDLELQFWMEILKNIQIRVLLPAEGRSAG